jgi:hypothetical protein
MIYLIKFKNLPIDKMKIYVSIFLMYMLYFEFKI